MSKPRYTASTITDQALDELYDNANRGWRRGDEWKAHAQAAEAAIARVRQMVTAWKERLPETIRTATAADAILTATEQQETAPRQYPITSHTYEGDGYLHPCRAEGYGTTCGAPEYDHQMTERDDR